MEQFNLEEYKKNPNRKVVTRQGKSVRIICTDRRHTDSWPIVALEDYGDGEFVIYANIDGRTGMCSENIHDLFFVDEEEKLTELQKTLEEDFDCYVNLYNDGKTRKELREWIKCWCNSIIDLARKELNLVDNTCGEYALNEAYKQGNQDVLKSLPKWKKATENKDLEKHVAILEDGKVLLSNYLEEGDYYIDLEDLKTLPKEE